mmetsp:Transcript_28202/g.56955  ORF Transcript_28202/g.56955 Transcript_28202/m.56955 type:complete len:246 (-) Transcript_28202:1672-2409(-)
MLAKIAGWRYRSSPMDPSSNQTVSYNEKLLLSLTSLLKFCSFTNAVGMMRYGEYVDILGVSVDSFDPATNAAIGRGGDTDKNQHVNRMLKVRELCSNQGILFKMNTVVCSLNHDEDMNEHVSRLEPYRWKAFQCLILKGENAGGPNDINDARKLQISKDQFDAFIDRHSGQSMLIPEPNTVMQNSYLLLDEELRFLDCSENGKVPSQSILEVGVEQALSQAGFDDLMFHKRGGIYAWTRERSISN